METKKIMGKVDCNYYDFLKDLEYLVNIDSGSRNISGLNKVAYFFKNRLEKLGCSTLIEESEEYGPVLVARKSGSGRVKVLLTAHMDTVWAEGDAKERPFHIKEDYAYGPGVTDCRSGMLSQYYVLKSMLELGINEFSEIILVFNPDEEIGSPFSRHILTDLSKKVDLALILEAADFPDEIITSRAGTLNYYIEVFGKKSHSGTAPEKGINAITEMVYKLKNIHELSIDGVTTNLATISGGEKLGIVAGYASAEVGFRVDNLDAVKSVESSVREIIKHNYIPNTKAVLKGGVEHPPFTENKLAKKYINIVSKCGKSIGMNISNKFCRGDSDGSFTGQEVVTIDGIAPYGSLYHTEGEYLDLKTVIPHIVLIILTILEINAVMK